MNGLSFLIDFMEYMREKKAAVQAGIQRAFLFLRIFNFNGREQFVPSFFCLNFHLFKGLVSDFPVDTSGSQLGRKVRSAQLHSKLFTGRQVKRHADALTRQKVGFGFLYGAVKAQFKIKLKIPFSTSISNFVSKSKGSSVTRGVLSVSQHTSMMAHRRVGTRENRA